MPANHDFRFHVGHTLAFLATLTITAIASWSTEPRRPETQQKSIPSGVFLPNLGQWKTSARYVSRSGARTYLVDARGLRVQVVDRDRANLRGHCVRLEFEQCQDAELLPGETLPTRYNFFLGRDPSKWKAGLQGCRSVRLAGLYEGVDAIVYEKGEALEYDLVFDDPTRVSSVVVRCDGIERLRLEDCGSLILDTMLGPIEQKPPKTWYELPSGERQEVRCRYVLLDETRFGFVVEESERPGRLVIDPGLVWSTYLGGASRDAIYAQHITPNGEILVGGETESMDFPRLPEHFRPRGVERRTGSSAGSTPQERG